VYKLSEDDSQPMTPPKTKESKPIVATPKPATPPGAPEAPVEERKCKSELSGSTFSVGVNSAEDDSPRFTGLPSLEITPENSETLSDPGDTIVEPPVLTIDECRLDLFAPQEPMKLPVKENVIGMMARDFKQLRGTADNIDPASVDFKVVIKNNTNPARPLPHDFERLAQSFKNLNYPDSMVGILGRFVKFM